MENEKCLDCGETERYVFDPDYTEESFCKCGKRFHKGARKEGE